mmetsp:Transcript_14047/g.17029  ORF Transcript_14047/g.17029 Transcript_14047/m.17029 type:complete len:124 (+) Transcript_14047:146-517(+)|eukprot:CAMPEP_0197854798 /NCGR_PEP_ID=MMETSP1438-20131217/25367_1 /TAXON_ID=1461541 /ORGANISM="Pterosperma sp., Strain CCMP1384" /LENGTH=123 /DNA_ID=CAMNT_0043469677 /DNA_START=132 /DNA_END=503 /DNA_ORIENTATION=-
MRQRKVPESDETSTSANLLVDAVAGKDDWEPEQLLDVIHWFRQILAVICGLIWGAVPFEGFIFIPIFFALNLVSVLVLVRSHFRVDPDEYGGLPFVLQEGIMVSMALFTLTWICTYSLLHTDQ